MADNLISHTIDRAATSRQMQSLRKYTKAAFRRTSRALGYQRETNRVRRVSIAKLLMGGERFTISAAQWARMTDDWLRPSTQVSLGPHAQLLQAYLEHGQEVLGEAFLPTTAYYRNALNCIEMTGCYFEAKRHDQIANVAKRFIGYFESNGVTNEALPEGASPPGRPVLVRPIDSSSCFEVIDGHHRVAIAALNGHHEIDVLPILPPSRTPVQSLLLDVIWEAGRQELYQPISLPELRDSWKLVRKCTDRFAMMAAFLKHHGVLGEPAQRSYLDVASNYGWFVSEMTKLGFASHGVERDPTSIRLGQIVYQNREDQISRADCVRFLSEVNQEFDVVSCFSIAHHFLLGRGSIDAASLVRLVANRTRSVLFFDMGQEHEAWFSQSLNGWSDECIRSWLSTHTGFRSVQIIGHDEDAVGPYAQQYNRALFACVR